MGRETSTTTRCSDRVDSVIGDPGEGGFEASAEVMEEVKPGEDLFLKLRQELHVLLNQILSSKIHGEHVGEERPELEHVCLVVEKFAL
jgi:hypothetical protein